MEHIFEDFNYQDGVYIYKTAQTPLGFDNYHFLFFLVDFANFVPEDYLPPVDIYHGNIDSINKKSLSMLQQTMHLHSKISRLTALNLDAFRKLNFDIDPFISIIIEPSKDKSKVRVLATIETTTNEYIYDYCAFPDNK